MIHFLSHQFSEAGYEVQELNFQLSKWWPIWWEKTRAVSYTMMLCPSKSHPLLQNYLWTLGSGSFPTFWPKKVLQLCSSSMLEQIPGEEMGPQYRPLRSHWFRRPGLLTHCFCNICHFIYMFVNSPSSSDAALKNLCVQSNQENPSPACLWTQL